MPTPSSKREWTDEYTLLCEKCGYVIEGLETNGNCPECGKPIAESLPERRVGTPWQQSRGLWSLLRTWYRVIRHPRRVMDEIQLQATSGDYLTLATLSVSSTIAILALLPLSHTSNPRTIFFGLIITLIISLIYVVISFLIIAFFSWIGRLSAMKRGFRIPPETAWQITEHGSVFSIFIPFGVILSIWLSLAASRIDKALYIMLGIQTDIAPTLRWIAGIALPMGFVLALVGIAMFVYHCEYRNRFTNRVKQGATTRVEDAQ